MNNEMKLPGAYGRNYGSRGKLQELDGVCNTLQSAMGTGGGNVPIIKEKRTMRIRKLTPKECWRLMGFNDEDFEKAEKVNSNTQLYKQAGNSIVVDVLEELFCMMLDEDGELFLWVAGILDVLLILDVYTLLFLK